MTAACKTAPRGGTTPKSSQRATPITTNVAAIGMSVATPGPNNGTRRDAGVTKTASSEPRTCSWRNAVPEPQSRLESHMYIA